MKDETKSDELGVDLRDRTGGGGHSGGGVDQAVLGTVANAPGSLVTQAENPPVVTSDLEAKRPPRKAKRVTSDAEGVKRQSKKVLPFQKKAISHVKQKEKAEWEIKECGCRLPKISKHEWRDFENGHRLLVVVGYGKSKNNKRVKKRDCVRYYTHTAMKEHWENEYESRHSAQA